MVTGLRFRNCVFATALPDATLARSVSIMNTLSTIFPRFGISLLLPLVVGSLACSTSDSPKAEAKEVAAGSVENVAGLAQETLLVLKFHHDN